MNKEINILIIEDDVELMDSYKRDINLHNDSIDQEKETKINPFFGDKIDDAVGFLDKEKIHASILDLKLSNDKDNEGEKIFNNIKSKFQMPVFIVSGLIQNLSEENNVPSKFYKIYSKDQITNDKLISEIIEICSHPIIKLINEDTKKSLEDYVNTIFWKHISVNIEKWEKNLEDEREKFLKIITRHISNHLTEYLRQNEEGENLDLHPSEFIISPPIKNYLYTGDILEKDNISYVLLNPACDFSNKKIDFYLLVKLIEIESVKSINKEDKSKLKDKLYNKLPRFHFIPYFNKNNNGYFLDFQSLLSISKEDIKPYSRKATIASQFLKDIISRFATYYSRQGQPEIEGKDKIIENILR